MKAVITFTIGATTSKTVFHNCRLGDERVANELDRLAKLRVWQVGLDFLNDDVVAKCEAV